MRILIKAGLFERGLGLQHCLAGMGAVYLYSLFRATGTCAVSRDFQKSCQTCVFMLTFAYNAGMIQVQYGINKEPLFSASHWENNEFSQ